MQTRAALSRPGLQRVAPLGTGILRHCLHPGKPVGTLGGGSCRQVPARPLGSWSTPQRQPSCSCVKQEESFHLSALDGAAPRIGGHI